MGELYQLLLTVTFTHKPRVHQTHSAITSAIALNGSPEKCRNRQGHGKQSLQCDTVYRSHVRRKKKVLLSHFVPGLQSVFYGLQSGFCSNSNAMHMNLITVMGRSTLSLFVIKLN